MGAAEIEEHALRILELLLPEEELAIHLDADPHAVGQGRARDAADRHDARRYRLGVLRGLRDWPQHGGR